MQTLILRLSCPAQTTAVGHAVEILDTDSQKTGKQISVYSIYMAYLEHQLTR